MTPDVNDLCVFAVKRGSMEGRIDAHFYLPVFQDIVRRVRTKPYIRLGEIAAFSKETTDFSEFSDGRFAYLEISGVSLGTNGYQTTTTDVAGAPSRARMRTRIGDIVISLTRPHRGAIAIICEEKIIASTGFSIIRDVDPNVEKSWLLYTLLSDISLRQMLQRSSGGNYPAITEEEVKRIFIPQISKEKQHLMVAELENKLHLLRAKLRQADELFAGTNDYILSALKIPPLDFESRLCCGVKISDIVSDKTFSAEYYHPERMAAIAKMKAIHDYDVQKLGDTVDFCRDVVSCDNSSQKYLGLAGVESQTGELSGIEEGASGQAFVYETGDVLYGRLRPYLNKVLLAENSGICSTEFHVMRVKDRSVILPEYLSAIMRSDLILSQTKHMMTGNTHPRITNEDVRDLYVPIPNMAVQEEIVKELKHRRTQARKLKREAEREWSAAKARFDKELLEE